MLFFEVITGFVVCLSAEGDLYFTIKLQNYTAVEKDEVILSCELSKATGDVKWFKDGQEIFPSKNVLFQSDGKKRTLVIKKAAKSSVGAYTCDCGTDRTTANLNIEGKTCGDPGFPPFQTWFGTAESGSTHQRAPQAVRCSPPLCPSLLRGVFSSCVFRMLATLEDDPTPQILIMTTETPV